MKRWIELERQYDAAELARDEKTMTRATDELECLYWLADAKLRAKFTKRSVK